MQCGRFGDGASNCLETGRELAQKNGEDRSVDCHFSRSLVRTLCFDFEGSGA